METTADLSDRLDGHLLLPGDDGYDQARTVWNAMIDRRPRLIVRCASDRDVVAAVRFARAHELTIGVRCGGHGIAGAAVPDDGLMIDLTPLSAVRVDPVRRRAWVKGGALLGALDRAAQEHGLATTAGNVSHTGVGGLTLGGGMGWLARQYGLTCDNVISYTMVTADGELLRASETEHPELYWGLRGGGGNFGIVTEFEFRLHPVGTQALIADFLFPIDDALPVLRQWRDLNAEAPRSATFTAGVGIADGEFVPPELRGTALAQVGFVWVGDLEEGRRLLPAMRAFGRPVAERVEELSYLRLQTTDDSVRGHARRRYWKGHYLTEFSDDAIRAFLLRGTADGTGEHLPSVSLQAYGGAIADVPDDDAAFSHRDTMFEYVAAAGWTEPGEDDSRIAAIRRCAAALEPYARGAYVNTLIDEGAAGVRRAYPAHKLARLTALKDRYDPDNVFRLNQNIAPSR
ncbi:FAD/FMN-containing dehydrogenase [Herbihabitans rhizosphaerae]|uniref:FAD/FMN-containing dehydrogenase n=1 Tax=Herbihabitans rhizosphaerae TaxID=1872711 RepID=A0A4V2ESJ3_9PSEU|nr:FAD-binding oxidoreductase [Herbihabitans rhizosphaerae]RZS37773.1 FAD/FMN-containing dehydrogenase [Herbihabitans rhizosphaerae]